MICAARQRSTRVEPANEERSRFFVPDKVLSSVIDDNRENLGYVGDGGVEMVEFDKKFPHQ